MQTISLRRPSVIHNLEKEPILSGRQEEDLSDRMDRITLWSCRISFAILALFYITLIGTVIFMAGSLASLYSEFLRGI